LEELKKALQDRLDVITLGASFEADVSEDKEGERKINLSDIQLSNEDKEDRESFLKGLKMSFSRLASEDVTPEVKQSLIKFMLKSFSSDRVPIRIEDRE